ncbi:MAG: type II toxin-antitoxin system RelE/ParE family toxin [Caulobacteraceae bacterium]
MKPLKAVFAPEALQDLANLSDFIVEASGFSAALRYLKRIEARCHRISAAPRAGKSRDDLAPGLRIVTFERRAVIAYRIVEERVQIVGVFYGGRDYEALLRASDDDAEARQS